MGRYQNFQCPLQTILSATCKSAMPAAYISFASAAQPEPGLAGEHGDERGHRGGVQQPLGAGVLTGGRRFPRSVGESEVMCTNLQSHFSCCPCLMPTLLQTCSHQLPLISCNIQLFFMQARNKRNGTSAPIRSPHDKPDRGGHPGLRQLADFPHLLFPGISFYRLLLIFGIQHAKLEHDNSRCTSHWC